MTSEELYCRLLKIQQRHKNLLPLSVECHKVGSITYLRCFEVFWTRVLRFVLVRDKVKSYEF